MLCEGTYYFPIDINSHRYVSPKNKSNNKTLSLREIINDNVNVKIYHYNDVLPFPLNAITQKHFISFTQLHVPMKEHDSIIYKNNRREIINSDISVSIGTQ